MKKKILIGCMLLMSLCLFCACKKNTSQEEAKISDKQVANDLKKGLEKGGTLVIRLMIVINLKTIMRP